jgi:hypothetical protein
VVTSILPIKVANIVILGVCYCTALELSKMQDQKALTLHSGSVLRGGSNNVAALCVYKGGQYSHYSLTLAHRPVIIQDARPEIRDTPLMLISMIRQ